MPGFPDQLMPFLVQPPGAHLFTNARPGGDEFTMLLDGIKDISDAIRVAARIPGRSR